MTTTEISIAQALYPIHAPRVITGDELGALQRVITGAGVPTTQRHDGTFVNESAARIQGVWMAAVEWACKAAAQQLGDAGAPEQLDPVPACFIAEADLAKLANPCLVSLHVYVTNYGVRGAVPLAALEVIHG